MSYKRKYPIGAEWLPEQGVHFRVWCPKHHCVELVLENVGSDPFIYKMKREKDHYFSYFSQEATEGTLYRYRLSGSEELYADPASRYQPKGPFGPSEVISMDYSWHDGDWEGLEVNGQVAYEMHIGTFTEKGTFDAARDELYHLANLGITFIELLPLNEFPGHFGWGYDGVNLFAPSHLYGSSKSLKGFIDKAHELGIGVVLDVVYNHLGPEGNQMSAFADEYLSDTFSTDWGTAINFDSPPSRQYFLTNAAYWIEEYHFDGLRVDATPWFFSSTDLHILAELTQVIKQAGGRRKTLAIGENEPQDTKLLRPYEKGGYGFDMLWNDDFHHSAVVRLTGKREAYYTDYLGSPQEFVSLIKYGFLYQGQYYSWQKKNRGTPDLNIPYHAMMVFLENHDQLANSGHGARLHTKADSGNYKAMVALFLLSPNTPLIFQGQEFNASNPFYYFADHSVDLSPLVRQGRRKELAQFPRLATREAKKILQDPENPLTFIYSKVDSQERIKNKHVFLMFKDLIKIRKTDPVFANTQSMKIDGAVLGTDSFVLRYFGGEDEGDRLLLVNFGPDHYLNPGPEPLLAPKLNHEFEVLWSSESIAYEGGGTPPMNVPYWKLLGHSTIVLKTSPISKKL